MISATSHLTTNRPLILTSRVIETFFSRVLKEYRPISTLTIVSPWISIWEVGKVGLLGLREMIDHRKIRTLILTRPPEHDWHTNALNILNSSSFVSIFLLEQLHAKIFVCEAIPVGFGLIGSANLTAQSLHNLEVAILFEGRGILSPLIKELKILIWQDLRSLSKKKY